MKAAGKKTRINRIRAGWVFLALAVSILVADFSAPAMAQCAGPGRYRVEPGGCLFDPCDSGPDQCDPACYPGAWIDDGSGNCIFEACNTGPDQCTACPGPGANVLDGGGNCVFDSCAPGPDECSPCPGPGGWIIDGSGACVWDNCSTTSLPAGYWLLVNVGQASQACEWQPCQVGTDNCTGTTPGPPPGGGGSNPLPPVGGISTPFTCGPDCATCTLISHAITDILVRWENNLNKQLIDREFALTQQWIYEVLWSQYVLPPLKAMTQEVTADVAWQTFIFGTFLDAKTQIETQRTLQEMNLMALKDYQPSVQMCRMASHVRGLAFSDKGGDIDAQVIGEQFIRRQTGSINTAGAEGEHQDLPDRLSQFKRRFCDIHDNSDGLAFLCPASYAVSPCSICPATTDRDIDYGGVVERALTLDDVFIKDLPDTSGPPSWSLPGSPGTAIVPHEDVMALQNNLYGHRVPLRMPESLFNLEENQKKMLDIRSVIAKRSVAEASFAQIVGMRVPGSGGAYLYTMPRMLGFLASFGLSTGDFLAKYEKAPSYYAQMEFLTKEIFRDQQFFVNLYDKPANIGRQKVVLQAFGLMQDFDTLQSYLRTEVMLSVLLELELIKLQRNVQSRIDQLKGKGS